MTFKKELTLDPGLLDLSAKELGSTLEHPTLFELVRPDVSPIFISVLLHGNETSGWDAVRSLLKQRMSNGDVPSLFLFVGNVKAAREGVRALRDQPDFNRIWESNGSGGMDWTEDLIAEVSSGRPWFAIDIHNNTCPNPHHSVITDMNPATLASAKRFSDIAIFALQPPGVLSKRCSQFCTAMTIEVGIPSDPTSATRAERFLDYLLRQGAAPVSATEDLRIYRNKFRVVIENARALEEWQVPDFEPRLSDWNFKTLKRGTKIAELKSEDGRLIAQDDHLNDVTDSFLDYQDNVVLLKSDVIMSMYTEDPRIALQDCVCYFLEPWL